MANKKSGSKKKSSTGNLIVLAGFALVILILLFKFVIFAPDQTLSSAKKGISALKQGDFVESEQQFDKFIEADPDLQSLGEIEQPAYVYLGLGNLELANNDYMSAAQYYINAWKTDSTLDFENLSRFASEKTRYPEAMYTQLGNQFWNAGIMTLAELTYKRPLKDNPDNTSVLTNLGNIARKRNDLDNAVKYYSRALAVDSSLYEARVNLVSVAYTNQDSWTFDFNLEKLEKYHPLKPYTLYFLAQQQRLLQNNDSALVLFEKFQEAAPNDQGAKLDIVDTYLDNSEYKPAQKIIRQLALRMGARPEIRERAISVAEKALEEEDFETALQYYSEYNEIWPDDPEFKFGQANSLLKLEKYEQARAIYLDLLTDYPNASSVWSNLGLVHVHMKKYDEAQTYFEEAVNIDSSAFALINLGRIYETNGDSVKAQGFYIAAAIKEPEMFDLKDFLMDTKLRTQEKLARGDTTGLIPLGLDNAKDTSR